MKLYFKKLSASEIKVAKECLVILEKYHDEIHLDMPFFLKRRNGHQGNANFCNTSCCLLGSHCIIHNPDYIGQVGYSGYSFTLGFNPFAEFGTFVFAAEWPADDKLHAKRRLEFCTKTGYVPCLAIHEEENCLKIGRIDYSEYDEENRIEKWEIDAYELLEVLRKAKRKKKHWVLVEEEVGIMEIDID